MTEYKLETPGFDARYAQQNQTKHCYQSYMDYHKCVDLKGDSFTPCKTFFKTYSSLCPTSWTEEWDDQREKGIFPGDLSVDQYRQDLKEETADSKS